MDTRESLRATTLWKIRGKKLWDQLQKGSTFHHNNVWIRYIKLDNSSKDPVRLACALSSRSGNAIARNKSKRRVRESVRIRNDQFQLSGYCLLVGVRGRCEGVSFSDIDNAISAFIFSIK